jgi:hydroxyacylglutathione hydrolase
LKDRAVADNYNLSIGDRITLKFIHTPGHSPESMCIQINDFALVTGDTLFIGECGRVDLPGGDANLLFDSFEKLRSLDRSLVVYPGHDYGDKPSSTLGEQLEKNYTLQKMTREEFVKFMRS